MEFIGSQLTALASWIGGYSPAFILLGGATYLATAYFAYAGQKTVYRVNSIKLEIDSIKNAFEGNPKELNQALLDMYAREGIKVSGFILGLVPVILLTLCVVFISLVVTNGVSEFHSTLLPWIQDLTVPDPLYVLPLTLGAVYWLQRRFNLRFNPPHTSKSKRYITASLPVFVLMIAAVLPAGVVMYWLSYSVLSVTQLYVVFQHVLSI